MSTMRCRRPNPKRISTYRAQKRLRKDTHIYSNPDGKHRIISIPFLEACCLGALEIKVYLVNEREHSRSERRHQLRISRCTAASKVVRVDRAGIILRNIVADPIRTARRGPAWEGWVAERV